jgi:signal transduction histidine kinase
LQLEVAADLAGDGELGTLTRRLHAEAARTTDDVRRMVRDLRPGELEELGLPAAVAAAAARLSSPHAPQFDLDTPASLPELSAQVEDAAYKICLEAMTNVIKHSSATRCTIRLSHTPTTLDLEISDDGRGITPNPTTGTGLPSMRERATAVGGQLTLSSGSPSGTIVRACLPHQSSVGCT